MWTTTATNNPKAYQAIRTVANFLKELPIQPLPLMLWGGVSPFLGVSRDEKTYQELA